MISESCGAPRVGLRPGEPMLAAPPRWNVASQRSVWAYLSLFAGGAVVDGQGRETWGRNAGVVGMVG